MPEDKEKRARTIRLRILRHQKELAASQQHARLGSFLRTNRPATIWKQAERDRNRLETEIARLREQLAVLTAPPKAPAVARKKKAATPKTKATAKRSPARKKAAAKKSKSAKKNR